MLNQAMEKSLSKMMTMILRHTPEEFGVDLDSGDGSCPVGVLLEAIQAQPKWAWVSQEDIEQVVRNSEKQRFEIGDGRIRARYGHSHDKVGYTPGEPPAILYHGTNKKALPTILKEGLSPMSRQYVHLSEGTHFAELAGSRRGELVILKVDTPSARQMGATFYYAGNEVWLADRVPMESLAVMEE
ncbi:RNA 2'-phosphotransferase [Paenibacillus sp. HN-1]|uniref:RNA 2'-phosphotransferase n=1 Tax=Paenibacillus TaxID=44249 RepID=UPI001CA98DA6|nr:MULTISPECIES: RNA 2'-phosphotransferase [Paenibacillus]MBY9079188.1 RNA 2'-phosphotransferase [Paenibacillus sp. CGMCC 1.18879]MBY9087351.1 RNA 2'-phosphotransferase [Paenibacillus sinensis]